MPPGVQLGLDRLLADGTPNHRAIVRFDAVPGRRAGRRSRDVFGLTVQPMRHLAPRAFVEGPVAAMVQVVATGIGLDVYPDERLELLDTPSSAAMSSTPAAARALRTRGLTGKGVTVAVVDSGCDATHADLADHVTHNVTLLSPEYVNAGDAADARRTGRPGAYQQHRPRQWPRHPRQPASSRPTRPLPRTEAVSGRPGRRARVLRDRCGAVHDRRHCVRLHARSARPARDRRRQQLVGQQLPPVRPHDPVAVATKAVVVGA